MASLPGQTAQQAQTALKKELEKLFEGRRYCGQQERKGLTVYEQDLPVDNGDDIEADTDAAAAPYIIAKMTSGQIRSRNDPQVISVVLIICCYDDDGKRQGYKDVANIKEDIVQHFCSIPFFGGGYTVLCDPQHPMTWAMQEDDTNPYYYGAVEFDITCPAMTSDTALEDLV